MEGDGFGFEEVVVDVGDAVVLGIFVIDDDIFVHTQAESCFEVVCVQAINVWVQVSFKKAAAQGLRLLITLLVLYFDT